MAPHHAYVSRADLGDATPEKRTVVLGRRSTEHLAYALRACPRGAPEPPSAASDRHQQQPVNLKLRRALNAASNARDTLVMRSSAAPLPVLGPGGRVKAEASHPVTRQPLRCGPARGPAGRIIPGRRELRERRAVLSVQLARLPHGSVLMVRRRSTVRFRNGALAHKLEKRHLT